VFSGILRISYLDFQGIIWNYSEFKKYIGIPGIPSQFRPKAVVTLPSESVNILICRSKTNVQN